MGLATLPKQFGEGGAGINGRKIDRDEDGGAKGSCGKET